MVDEKPTSNDHDLLIRLDTRFEDFTKAQAQMWTTFNEMVNRISLQIGNKIDKSDMNVMRDSHDALEKRVSELENKDKNADIQRQTIIQVGKLGWKFWGSLGALILFVITLYNAIKK